MRGIPKAGAVLIVALIIVGAGLAAFPDDEASNRLSGLSTLFAAAVAAHHYAARWLTKYQLTLERTAARVTNRTTEWGIVVELSIADPTQALDAVSQSIQDRSRRRPRVVQGLGKIFWNIDGATLTASVTQSHGPSEETGHILRVEIGPISAGYRTLTAQVERRWIPLVDEVARNSEASATKFTMRVGFPDGNPYFKLLLMNRPTLSFVRFVMDFREGAATIKVREDAVTVTSGQSLEDARRLSDRYLAMRSMEDLRTRG